MKLHLLLPLALSLGAAPVAWSQTADDYVTWGRSSLAATNLAAAQEAFAYALTLEPNHETANALFAATRLLLLPSQPAGSNFLSRLGLTTGGRDLYHWTAQLPLDRSGDPVVPAGVNANEFTAMLRTNVLAAIIGAEANLAKVADTNFLLTLTADETRLAGVTLDYGDIQMLRAILQSAEYFAYTTYSWNLDAQLTALRSFMTNDEPSVERLLMDYPSLLTFATTNDLTAGKAAFRNGVDRYLAASRFIRSRPAGVTRLFNYDADMSAREQDFRSTLVDLTNSLSGMVTLTVQTNYGVFLGAHFSGAHSPRSFLPEILGNGFVLGSLPDPTFGGLITGLQISDIEQSLAGPLRPIPSIAPSFSFPAGQFGFPLHVLSGRGYVVQVSTNLTIWSDCPGFPAFIGESDTHVFADPNAGSFQRRFYRLVDRTENMPPPLNDNFANRIALTGLGITATGYNANASTEPGEPGSPWSSAWWSWTAPVSGTVILSTRGSQSSQWVRIYTGSSLGALVFVAYAEQLFDVVAGTTYQIQVSGGSPNPGGVKLTITAPPTVTVLSPTNMSVVTSPTNILINAFATDNDGSISQLRVFGDYALLGSAANATISLTWSNVSPGNHVIWVVATDNLGVSTYSPESYVNVTPPNDDFSNRIPIAGNAPIVLGTSIGASKEIGEPNHAGQIGSGSVWWSWIAPSNGVTLISAWLYDEWGPAYYPVLGVYTGNSVTNLTVVASNSASSDRAPAIASFYATAGNTYQIAVDGRNGYQGNVFMKLVQPQSQPATILIPGVLTTNLSGAAGSMAYYTGTIPPGVHSVQISTWGGTGDCDLYVRFGALPTLTEWDYRPYLEGNEETVTLQNPAAGDWYILLHGYESYSGVTLLAQ